MWRKHLKEWHTVSYAVCHSDCTTENWPMDLARWKPFTVLHSVRKIFRILFKFQAPPHSWLMTCHLLQSENKSTEEDLDNLTCVSTENVPSLLLHGGTLCALNHGQPTYPCEIPSSPDYHEYHFSDTHFHHHCFLHILLFSSKYTLLEVS